jgi:hypothetical protein
LYAIFVRVPGLVELVELKEGCEEEEKKKAERFVDAVHEANAIELLNWWAGRSKVVRKRPTRSSAEAMSKLPSKDESRLKKLLLWRP